MRFIIIAVKPKITISSFTKDKPITIPSPPVFTGFPPSFHLKKINNKNVMLQISVNRDKNKTTFINV